MYLAPSQNYIIQQANPKLQTALESINNRDKEKNHTNPSFKSYEFNLSHTRAVARISDSTNKQYFQGSSFNRKKRPVNEQEKIQTPTETLNQSFFKAKRYRDKLLRNVESIAKRKQVEDRGMSRRTKIKIKEKMMAVYAASKNNFTLCTLTLIGDAEDTKAVKVLNKYFTVLRKKYNQLNYVWVAERQKNGRIHFHIIIDRRFDIDYINSLWVIQQFNAGIIHEEAKLKLEVEAGTTFKKLHKLGPDGWKQVHKYLNPVDVANVKTIDGVSAYLTNYVTKNETKLSCQIWHCNRNVSRIFTKQLISKKVFNHTSNPRINKIKKLNGRLYTNKTFIHQYGIINNIYNKKYFRHHLKELDLINSWILKQNEKNPEITEGIKIGFDRFTEILYSYDQKTGETKTASLKDHKTTSQLIQFCKTNKN